MIWLFTDGACSGNPGPGSWAWILDCYSVRTQGAGYVASTTNNRMELTAVLEGLKSLGTCSAVTVVSDSAYVVQGMQRWIHGWQANGWKNSQKKPVENQDLWKALIEVAQKFPNIIWQWVKGHGTHADNIEVDALARDTLKTQKDSRLAQASDSISCLEDTKEWRPVFEWWIGDVQHRRGLWTRFVPHSGLTLAYFQDVHPTIFLGLEWQKTCLDTVISYVKPNAMFCAGLEPSLTVKPQLEERSAYEAYGFSPTSLASTTWKKILLVGCFLGTFLSHANTPTLAVKKNAPKHAYLKSKKVYWRSGPGNEHPVTWIYSTPGWPVFIRKRWSYWCQIQDVKGTIGWVHGNLLVFRRIAFITHTKTPLRTSHSSQSSIKAYLQPGVLALCIEQHADWMRVRLLKERYEGWIHIKHMWQPEQEKHHGKK
jgi:ribonuclease HI